MNDLRSIGVLGILTLLLAVLAACGSSSPSTGNTTAAGLSPAASPAVGASPASGVVTIVATDSGYDAPASIPSGVTTFRMINRGTTIHWAQLAKIPAGHTIAELDAGTTQGPSPIPGWLELTGGPNSVEPGDSSMAIMNLDPGQYALVLFHPGAKNLVKPIQVTASNGTTAAESSAATTIKTVDYGYEFSTPITPGNRVIRVENTGTQAHEAVIDKLLPGKTAEDYIAWEKGGEKGAAPGTSFGGLTAISPGLHGYFMDDFTPGNYLVLCYVPDVRDGKPHYLHGMYKAFSVS